MCFNMYDKLIVAIIYYIRIISQPPILDESNIVRCTSLNKLCTYDETLQHGQKFEKKVYF